MKIKIPFFKEKNKTRQINDKIIETVIKLEDCINNGDFTRKIIEDLTELYSVI